MKTRIWNELSQIKYNENYCVLLLAYKKRWLNNFNIVALIFSGAGVMGWGIWKEFPLVACIIIGTVQLLKLIQPHIIPSEKKIEQLMKVTDFYFDYYNSLEQLWHKHPRLSEVELEQEYYLLKKTEKEANNILKEILKKVNKGIDKMANERTGIYLSTNFNLQ